MCLRYFLQLIGSILTDWIHNGGVVQPGWLNQMSSPFLSTVATLPAKRFNDRMGCGMGPNPQHLVEAFSLVPWSDFQGALLTSVPQQSSV